MMLVCVYFILAVRLEAQDVVNKQTKVGEVIPFRQGCAIEQA